MKIKFFVIVSLLNIFYIKAQDRKSDLSLGVMLSHFDRIKSNELSLGSVPYNVNPGIEFLYNYKFGSYFKLGTGLSYQYANLISHVETSDKFKFGELSIPILFTLFEKTNRFSLESGIYAGKFLHFSWLRESHSQWTKVKSYSNQVGYKENDAFVDLYLAISIKANKKNVSPILISPFVRFRLMENWMDHYRESSYYGVKLTAILFKIKKDEKN